MKRIKLFGKAKAEEHSKPRWQVEAGASKQRFNEEVFTGRVDEIREPR